MVYFAEVQLSPNHTSMHEYLPSFYFFSFPLCYLLTNTHWHHSSSLVITMILDILLTSYGWQAWDYTGLGYTRYNARDVGKEYLGYALTKAAVIC